MPVSLDTIIAATRGRVARVKEQTTLRELERRAEQHVPRGFRQGLQRAAQSGVAIIAELKKASPSRGLIRASFNPAELAAEFEKAGAAALSILTDEDFFQGSLDNLRAASTSTHLACLRKDFIVDEFQLLEARANHADAVLLIVAALSQSELLRLAQLSRELELDLLCEAHDRDELGRAIDAGCDIIGINSRDLRTFSVNLETAFRLADQLPANALAVAESGIDSAADIVRLRAAGYQAFLIGESLMRAESPGEALQTLLLQSRTPVSSL